LPTVVRCFETAAPLPDDAPTPVAALTCTWDALANQRGTARDAQPKGFMLKALRIAPIWGGARRCALVEMEAGTR